MVRIADLIEQDSYLNPTGGCHSCPRKKKRMVPGTFVPGTDLLILGEAPGSTEVETGEGFTGPSGQFLRETLAKFGITEYSLSNTIHCRPPNNRNPNVQEISCCLNQFVLAELAGFKYVLLAGNVPMNALFPGVGVSRLRGNLTYHPDFEDTRFFGCYHPAYIKRRSDMKPVFEAQIERLARIVHGEADADIDIIQGDAERVMPALDEMLATGFISLDVETDRLESWELDAEIRSLAVASDTERAVFIYEEDPYWVVAVERIKDFLANPSSRVVGHNIGFDLDFMEWQFDFRVRARGILDTQSLYYLAEGDKMSNLKMLVARELDGYRHHVVNPHEEENVKWLSRYNAEDVVYPIQLLRKGLDGLHPRTVDLFMRVSGPSGYHLRRMTSHGFYFDVPKWEEGVKEIAQQRQDLLESWADHDYKFRPGYHESGKGLEEYLFELKGYPIIERTKTERPSTAAGVLKGLVRRLEESDQDPTPVKNLLKLRKIDKKKSTYIDPYEGHVWPDGFVRSSYHNTVTDSGRRSSRGPNIQNLPRGKSVRQYFRARPGNVLVQGDYSQIELRVAMCLAKDPVGLAAYNRGEDLHTETARIISGNPNPTKEERTNAKPVNFSLIYGAHWTRLKAQAAEDYGIWLSDEECQEYHELFFGRYKQLPIWHERTHNELRARQGKAMHIVGHPYYYEDWNHPDQGRRDHAFRAHLNSKCQGPAAYLNMYLLILTDRMIHEAGIPATIVHEEHDSVVVDTPEEYVDRICSIMNKAAQKCHEWVSDWFVIPLVVEFEVGPNRGELQDYNPT